MKTNILMKINTQYNEFSQGEQRIADVIQSSSHRQLLSMSISQLAYMANTSEAGVYRFCRKLGLNGFQEFHDCILDQALRQPSQRHVQGAVQRPRDPFSIQEITEYLFAQYHETLSLTKDALSEDRIATVVGLIQRARGVYFFGAGASLISAQQAKMLFMRCVSNAYAYPSLHLQEQSANTMTPDDLAIIFSVSGATLSVLRIAQQLKKNGVCIVCVSNYEKTALSAYADVNLLTCPCGGSDSYVTLSSCITQMIMISVLYNALSHRQPPEEHNAAAFDRLLADRML